MDDAGGVGRRQRPGGLADQPGQLVQGRAAGRRSSRSVRPSTSSMTRKGRPSCSPSVVDGADVRVVQGGGGAGLAAKPRQHLPVAGTRLGQELQRDEPVEPGVFGAVDDAHAAAPSRSRMM